MGNGAHAGEVTRDWWWPALRGLPCRVEGRAVGQTHTHTQMYARGSRARSEGWAGAVGRPQPAGAPTRPATSHPVPATLSLPPSPTPLPTVSLLK